MPCLHGPFRRQIDLLLLQGWRADKIVRTVRSVPYTAAQIRAHHCENHIEIDRPTFEASVITMMQEKRQIDEQVVGEVLGARFWLSDPERFRVAREDSRGDWSRIRDQDCAGARS